MQPAAGRARTGSAPRAGGVGLVFLPGGQVGGLFSVYVAAVQTVLEGFRMIYGPAAERGRLGSGRTGGPAETWMCVAGTDVIYWVCGECEHLQLECNMTPSPSDCSDDQ